MSLRTVTACSLRASGWAAKHSLVLTAGRVGKANPRESIYGSGALWWRAPVNGPLICAASWTNGVVLLSTFFSIRILYGWYLTINFMHTLFAAGERS